MLYLFIPSSLKIFGIIKSNKVKNNARERSLEFLNVKPNEFK